MGAVPVLSCVGSRGSVHSLEGGCRCAAGTASTLARVLTAAFLVACLALHPEVGAVPAQAAANLNITSATTINSNAAYNNITGSGANLTVTGAKVTANDIRCATVHMLARNAIITSAQNFRMGPMYVENSTLTAGNIFQSAATGRMVTDNSHIDADTISLGWDYLLNGGFDPNAPESPDSSGKPVPAPDAPHQHNNSVLTAKNSVMLYGGLEVVSGDTVVTCQNGNIFARMVDGLTQRPGATLTLRAPKGKITAQKIVATNVLAESVYANNVTIEDGSFTLTGALDQSANQNIITENLTLRGGKSSIEGLSAGAATVSGGELTARELDIQGALTLENSESSIDTLSVGGAATISGGTLKAGNLDAGGGLTVNEHARAGIDALTLANESLLAVNSRVAVASFRDSAGASAVVGHNAALGLGTSDPDWIVRQFDTADASSLGPVTAALAVAAPQTLDTLPGIVVDGSLTAKPADVASGKVVFAPESLLVVKAAAADEHGAGALSGGSFDVRSGAKLYIPDAVNGGTYKVLSDNGNDAYADESAWNGANLASGTPLLDLVRLEQFGMIGTRQVSAESVFTRLHPYLVDMLDKTYAEGLIGPDHVDSGTPGIRFLSRAISRDYIANDGRLAATTIESAARMAALGAVPQMTLAANQAASNGMGQRLGTEPGGGVRAMGEDGKPVEDGLHRHGWALWAMPIFQSTNGFGMTAGNWDLDFSGALGGVALGCDYTFESALRLGLSLNVGGGYARGSGELAATTNHMGFWGLGAYAGWHAGDFGLAADVAYTSAYNSLTQDLPAGMEMRSLKSDISSWAIGAGLRADYRIATPWLDVTPHAGARYHYLHTGSYDVKSNGTVLEADATRQNIWTFPVGFSLSRDLALPRGWRCRPMLDFSVIPAAGDMDAKADVRFTGTGIDSDLENQVMDHITWRGALGVEFAGDEFALGLNYSFQGGRKTTAHGITASFSYQF